MDNQFGGFPPIQAHIKILIMSIILGTAKYIELKTLIVVRAPNKLRPAIISINKIARNIELKTATAILQMH